MYRFFQFFSEKVFAVPCTGNVTCVRKGVATIEAMGDGNTWKERRPVTMEVWTKDMPAGQTISLAEFLKKK